MKSTVADYRYRVLCVRIVPVTGATVRLTDYPTDLTMSGGQVYLSTNGYALSGYSATSDFSPSSIDLEGIAGIAGISRAAVASGVFDGARVYGFATDWTSPVEDEDPLTSGVFGETQLLDDRYKISGVSMVDLLGQAIGKTYGPTCDKTFCSQGFAGCKADLEANTVTGTLTDVTSPRIFRDAARSEPDDTFGAGSIRFTSGANAGLKAQEIKTYADDGTIELNEGFYYLPEVGDAYSMVRGCRKRLEDCKNRLGGSNILNFGGFPNAPTSSQYSQVGGQV